MIEFEQFPNDFAERYSKAGYWRGEVLGNLLCEWAQKAPDRIAIIEENRYWTYSELNEKANRFAAGLQELDIKPGDRIVVQLPNIALFAIVSIGMFRLGVIPVYALPNHRSKEICYLCEYSEAVAYLTVDVFHGFDYREIARQIYNITNTLKHIFIDGEPEEFTPLHEVNGKPQSLPTPSPRDVAFFLLSGGTTGLPKLIPRTHDDYCYQLRATAEALNFNKESAYLATLPIAHNAALGCPGLLGSLYVGAKTILPSDPSPDTVFSMLEKERATLTTLMPPFVLLWLESAALFNIDLSHMTLQVGSARFAPELAKRVRSELGCTLTQWFGMAEGLLTYTRLNDDEDVVNHTQGRPLSPLDEIKVCDNNGKEIPDGEIGELITRGPYTLRGYYKAPEHNSKAFTHDGFLRTGDLVRITPEGNMIVEGRIKDVINRGGEKIVASEVEDLLVEHPAIREAAVVAMPDTVMGEKTCVFAIALNQSQQLKLLEIKAFLREKGLAEYKLPDRLEIIDSMPRTTVGKLNKSALAELIREKLIF